MEIKEKSKNTNWELPKAYAGAYPESEYVRVTYVLETPTYYHEKDGIQSYYIGFDTDEARNAFYESAGDALKSFGFAVSCGCSAMLEKAHLYIHPQEISGSVRKNDVVRIAECLSRAHGFSVEWIELYEEELDISDAEYISRLDAQAGAIRKAILEAAKTKRRDYYHGVGETAVFVADIFRISRIGKPDGETSCGYGKTSEYITRHIDSLIDEGYLVAARAKDGTRLIRTINKTEQRQRKLSIA